MPFYCNEYGCDATFNYEEELDNHILSGKHNLLESLSSLDNIKSIYRLRASSDITKFRSGDPIPSSSSSTQCTNEFYKPGWALPIRKCGRLDKEVREFCLEKFITGEQKGKKFSPNQIVQMIRNETLPGSPQKRFSPPQYMTVNQVKNIMSRFTKFAPQIATNQDLSNANYNNFIDLLPIVSIKNIKEFFISDLFNLIFYKRTFFLKIEDADESNSLMQKVCHNNNQAIEIPINKGVNILESIDPKPANTVSSRSNTKKNKNNEKTQNKRKYDDDDECEKNTNTVGKRKSK